MQEVTLFQHNIVVNAYSFTIAAMGIAALFLFLKRSEVLPRYRTGVTLLGLVSTVAAYNYVRLMQSWHDSFTVVAGAVKQTGIPYDDSYRYADWLLTVPMLLVGLVMVLDLSARQARSRSFILGLLAAEMILLGYPGQISTDAETRWVWWGISMVPFLLIIQQLYFGLSEAVRSEPKEARKLVAIARLMTVVAWSVYPIIYVLPMFDLLGPNTFVSVQVAYAAADILAKAAYGVVISMIATSKSEPAPATAAEYAPAMRA